MLQIAERVKNAARIQDGDVPPEDARELLEEYDRLATEFTDIVARINHTNLTVQVSGVGTMTEALARRDTLKLSVNTWRTAADTASSTQTRTTRSEVKFVPGLNVKEARDRVDRLSKELRELDIKIQEANWASELVD